MDKIEQMIPNWIIEPMIKAPENVQGEFGNGMGKVFLPSTIVLRQDKVRKSLSKGNFGPFDPFCPNLEMVSGPGVVRLMENMANFPNSMSNKGKE